MAESDTDGLGVMSVAGTPVDVDGDVISADVDGAADCGVAVSTAGFVAAPSGSVADVVSAGAGVRGDGTADATIGVTGFDEVAPGVVLVPAEAIATGVAIVARGGFEFTAAVTGCIAPFSAAVALTAEGATGLVFCERAAFFACTVCGV